MEAKIIEFLKEIDVNPCIVDYDQESKVARWLKWYKGFTNDHTFYVYNGKQKKKQYLKTLNMASQVCNDLSDFFFNEKLDINVSDTKYGEELKEILRKNNFLYNSNKCMQLVEATGTGAIVPYLDNDEVKINYLNASNILILGADNSGITSVLFHNQEKTIDGVVLKINAHILTDDGYVIHNREYIKTSKDSGWVKQDLGDLEKIETKSKTKQFAILKVADINNDNIDSYYGTSCFSNSEDVLISIDRTFDSYDNEIWLGRKRVYVQSGAAQFNVNENGQTTPVFDPSDTAFYALPKNDKEPMVKESQFDLRISDIKNALQGFLNLLSGKVGLGHNYYKFQDGEVYVNTDNVISSNSDVYRKIKKQENVITNAITDVAKAIAELTERSTDFTVSVDYDDSIIEDSKAIKAQALTELGANIISKVQYFMDTCKMNEEEAIKFVEKQNEQIKKYAIVDGREPVE